MENLVVDVKHNCGMFRFCIEVKCKFKRTIFLYKDNFFSTVVISCCISLTMFLCSFLCLRFYGGSHKVPCVLFFGSHGMGFTTSFGA